MKRTILLALALWPAVAMAQTTPPPVTSYQAGWTAVGPLVSLGVTGSSASVQLGWVGQPGVTQAPPSAFVCNTGTVPAYVAFGASSVVAKTTNGSVLVGSCRGFALSGASSYMAGISAGGSTTLTVESGTGNLGQSASLNLFGAGAITDASGTITSGATAQQLVAASTARSGIRVMNLSGDPLCLSWVSVTPVCGQAGTYTLNAGGTGVAGGSYVTPVGFPEHSAIYIIGATTGDAFAADFW